MARAFQFKLLRDLGGWWVDLDSCGCRAFVFGESVVLSSEFTREGARPSCSAMKLPAGHPLARALHESAAETPPNRLATDWLPALPWLLSTSIDRLGLAERVRSPTAFDPIPAWAWPLLFSQEESTYIQFLPQSIHAIHCHRSQMIAGRRLEWADLRLSRGAMLGRLLERNDLWPAATQWFGPAR